MKQTQWIVLGLCTGLFLVLYFGCETKAPEQKAIEKSRALNIETTTITNLLRDAKSQLTGNGSSDVLSLEAMLEQSATDTQRLEVLKKLSGTWFDLGFPAIAGFYAEEVANTQASANAWSMAGTTYMICLQRPQEEKVKAFCLERAVASFESAISENPEDPTHKLNLALVYTEQPPQDNPMKGILMLRDLNQQDPENPAVLYHLGRLAIMTGQFEKAVERLSAGLKSKPDSKRIACLLSEAYQGLGDTQNATLYQQACEQNAN